jgi:hypothetical protein
MPIPTTIIIKAIAVNPAPVVGFIRQRPRDWRSGFS